MSEHRTERRLAAVLAADMVGYSARMEADEAGTLARHNSVRAEIIDPLIDEHRGRVFKLTGDGILAEFSSVIDAVNAAISIQRALSNGNSERSREEDVRYRIGINLGDVIEDGGDLFGDGVNIAARLEQMAEPGGICISGAVFDQLKQKIDAGYQNLGDIQVKNITQPVRVYRVLLDPGATGKLVQPPWWQRVSAIRATYLLAALAVVTAGGVYWWQSARVTGPGGQSGPAVVQMAQASIAVLPFRNLAETSDQNIFTTGLTADLTSALSRVPELLVISPLSTSKFKSRQDDIQAIASELKVENILTGSVQKSEDRIRVVVQLTNGKSGAAIWSNRYDRELKDFFALQDDIVKNVLVELQVQLTFGETARAASSGTDSLEAWLLSVQAEQETFKFQRESNLRARRMYEAAARADPEWGMPEAGVSWTYREALRRGWSDDPDADRKRGIELARKAIEMAPDLPFGYFQLGNHLIESGRVEEGIEHREKALKIAPSNLFSLAGLGWQLFLIGEQKRALELHQRAKLVSPIHPWWLLGTEALIQQYEGNLERAIELFIETGKLSNNAIVDGRLAAAYAEAGQMENARKSAQAYLKKRPDGKIADLTRILRFKDKSKITKYASLLAKAGIPD